MMGVTFLIFGCLGGVYLTVFLVLGCVFLSQLPSDCGVPHDADSVFYASNALWLTTLILGGCLMTTNCGSYFTGVLCVASIAMLITSMVITIMSFTEDKNCLLAFNIVYIIEVYLAGCLITIASCITCIGRAIQGFDV